MTGPQAGFERRVHGALDAAPSRIPVVLGGCGTGRTWLLQRLRERAGRQAAQYIDVERMRHDARTVSPGRDVGVAVPVAWRRAHAGERAREAFDALLAFFDTARAPGGEPCTFLLDEVLELRTFESFPGLRHVLRELLEALAGSPNRFVLTTRYVARAHRLLRDATARFEVMHLPPLRHADVTDLLAPAFNGYEQMADRRPRLSSAAPCRRSPTAAPSTSRAIGEAMADMGGARRSDQRADRAAVGATARSTTGAASATSCGCIAPAATARSRPSSTSSPKKSR